MEIRKITLYLLEMRLRSPFTTSFGTMSVRPVLLARIEEKGGEEGWGECVAGVGPWYSYETVDIDYAVSRRYIAPALVGAEIEEPGEFRRLTGRIRGYPMAKAMFEEALLDLYARLRGLSLAELLGGRKGRVKVGVSIGIKPTIDELLREVGRRLEEGYERIKIKIKPGWDVEPVKRIREEYGDILLQVDANASYTLKDLYFLRKLDKYELLMLEQPFHYDDLLEHRVAARKLSTPICLDESVKSLHDAVLASRIGAAEIVNVKPGRVGGPLEGKRILDYAPGLGLGAWIGGMLETGVGRSFLVALASHPAVTFHSDISASSRYWHEDIVDPPWELKEGSSLEVPRKPGLGVEVKTEHVEKRAREVWSTA